jgi:hypothetical protein
VNVEVILAEHDVKHNLRDPAEGHHPQVDEEAPELILGSWINRVIIFDCNLN